jgi:hypothetical protein
LSIVGNTVGVGFVAYIFVLLVLVRNGVAGDVLFGITLVYFGALVAICLMLFWQARLLAKDKQVTMVLSRTAIHQTGDNRSACRTRSRAGERDGKHNENA